MRLRLAAFLSVIVAVMGGAAGIPAMADSSSRTPPTAGDLSRGDTLPDRAPNSNGLPTPTLASIISDIRHKMGPDRSVFWTANTKIGAALWAHARNRIVLTDTDTEQEYGTESKWIKWSEVATLWSTAFAQLSSGTVWVVFRNHLPISDTGEFADSVWNKHELPNLIKTVNGRPPVDEIIQIGTQDDATLQVQIWPVDIRRWPKDECRWVGRAPNCHTACPAGTKNVAKSFYGLDVNRCKNGNLVYCCREGATASDSNIIKYAPTEGGSPFMSIADIMKAKYDSPSSSNPDSPQTPQAAGRNQLGFLSSRPLPVESQSAPDGGQSAASVTRPIPVLSQPGPVERRPGPVERRPTPRAGRTGSSWNCFNCFYGNSANA